MVATPDHKLTEQDILRRAASEQERVNAKIIGIEKIRSSYEIGFHSMYDAVPAWSVFSNGHDDAGT
jgi:hypothetical protein